MSGAAHQGDVVTETVTPVHRLPPQCKVLALLVFVVAVALVPRDVLWPYAGHAVVLAAVAAFARVPLRMLGARLLIEIPFVLFVLVLPLVSTGERVDVLGVPLSVAGLWTAWNVTAKATLALLATAVLSATTPPGDVVGGLERLRVPTLLTSIASFAVRYLEVLLDELRRMQLARRARGDDPRWLWQATGVARTVGALVARSFSRGERVHLAMLARGFDGRLPMALLEGPAPARVWAATLPVPLTAVALTAAAWGLA